AGPQLGGLPHRRRELAAAALGWRHRRLRLAHRGAQSVTVFALPPDASLDGFRIDRLIALGAWIQVPLLAVLALWLVGAALRWGKRHPAVFERGGHWHLPAVA